MENLSGFAPAHLSEILLEHPYWAAEPEGLKVRTYPGVRPIVEDCRKRMNVEAALERSQFPGYPRLIFSFGGERHT
jgi:hypothetical protein